MSGLCPDCAGASFCHAFQQYKSFRLYRGSRIQTSSSSYYMDSQSGILRYALCTISEPGAHTSDTSTRRTKDYGPKWGPILQIAASPLRLCTYIYICICVCMYMHFIYVYTLYMYMYTCISIYIYIYMCMLPPLLSTHLGLLNRVFGVKPRPRDVCG